MYRQFNIQKVLRSAQTTYFWVLCGSQKKMIISLYCINLWFFCNRYLTLYSPVVTKCTTSLKFNNSTFCPLILFLCFVWISKHTGITSLYNINWQVFIRDLTLYSPVVSICTTSLTFNNSTFCPHSCIFTFCVDLRTNSEDIPMKN